MKNPNKKDIDKYLATVKYDKILTQEEKDMCNKDITKEELKYIIFLKNEKSKSPGLDGIPAEFYQTFWDELNDSLLIVFKEVFEKEGLTNTQRISIMSLLHKKGATTDINNYRPLSK